MEMRAPCVEWLCVEYPTGRGYKGGVPGSALPCRGVQQRPERERGEEEVDPGMTEAGDDDAVRSES